MGLMTLRAVKFNIDQIHIDPFAALAIFDALLNLKIYSIKKSNCSMYQTEIKLRVALS